MGFLNHREGGMVSIRFSSFLLYRNLKEKMLTVNIKEENSYDFCLDLVQEFCFRMRSSRVVRAYS
jgi:hypothetical protein